MLATPHNVASGFSKGERRAGKAVLIIRSLPRKPNLGVRGRFPSLNSPVSRSKYPSCLTLSLTLLVFLYLALVISLPLKKCLPRTASNGVFIIGANAPLPPSWANSLKVLYGIWATLLTTSSYIWIIFHNLQYQGYLHIHKLIQGFSFQVHYIC